MNAKIIVLTLVLLVFGVWYLIIHLQELNVNKANELRKNRKYKKNIQIDLEDAVVSSVAVNYTEPQVIGSVAHGLAKSFDEPPKQKEVVMSCFTIKYKDIKGQVYDLKSPLLSMDKTSLKMLLLQQKNTTLSYDNLNLGSYWIDIDFLE